MKSFKSAGTDPAGSPASPHMPTARDGKAVRPAKGAHADTTADQHEQHRQNMQTPDDAFAAGRQRSVSAPSPVPATDLRLLAPQRSRAQTAYTQLPMGKAAPSTLRGWKVLCAVHVSRAKAALGSSTAFPTLAPGDTYVDHANEQFPYSDPEGATRHLVGIYSCTDERDLDTFNVKRVNNILEGIADGKKFIPLMVNRDRMIVNGGHRLLVAQMLGLEEVTVLIV